MLTPVAILVDARSWPSLKEAILEEVAGGEIVGVDLETHDEDRHEGLNKLMKVDDEGFKGGNTKLIFDTNRTTITGFSVYTDGEDHAWYVNVGHADVENRLDWGQARQILDAIKGDAMRLAHNASYELTMLRKCKRYDLGDNTVCTMQLAVTAFNADTYALDDFLQPGFGGISRLFSAINKAFYSYQPGAELDRDQEELLFKVIAKESKAEHSYNGYVKDMAYTFGLKKLVKRFLGYTQVTFEEVLNGKAHMGQLTGEEACAYGADDAWCAVKLYHKLIEYLIQNNPAVIPTFFDQENPMIHVYSEVWGDGVNIDIKAVKRQREFERAKVASTLRVMKAAVRNMLPFPEEPHEKLVKYDPKKYNVEKYRGDVKRWAAMPDSSSDFEQLYQVKSALSKAWAEDKKLAEPKGMSINYYQVVRCMLYDLCGCSFQLSQGKVQSDKEAQAKMRERLIKKATDKGLVKWDPKDKAQSFPIMGDGDKGVDVWPEDFERFKNTLIILDSFRSLADSETTMKLFINNYLNMTDPATGKIYPVLNSLLNSRRMALASPNLSQLAKFGPGGYVRGFFEPDEKDHVVLTMDWSSIELVLIGEASGDPEFAKFFGQLPFGDMHSDTAATLLDQSLKEFKAQANAKQLRTDVGKGANFNYWYSGALGTVADELGLSSEKMWEYVDRFRMKFAVAEAWRQSVIADARETGIVVLPDHHHRIRFESTYAWAGYMRAKAEGYGPAVQKFIDLCIRRIQTRSGNQAVNSKIQGTCATLAKRSILRVRNEVLPRTKLRARFMYPVHDELVFSVHKDDVIAFKKELYNAMCIHPDIVKNLMLDASASIGNNYWAYDPVKNKFGQIELDELSKLDFIPQERWGQKATEEETQQILDYLMTQHEELEVA